MYVHQQHGHCLYTHDKPMISPTEFIHWFSPSILPFLYVYHRANPHDIPIRDGEIMLTLCKLT
jgi:hypothetical protein